MNPVLRRLTRSIDIAGAAACVSVVAALIFGGIVPLLHHRTDARMRTKELIKQRHRVEVAKASVVSMQAQLAAAHAALAQNPIHLEDAGRINHRLARINDLASGRGLQVQGVDPGNTTRGTRYQTIDMKLAGQGGYRGCVQFLRDLHDKFPDTAVTAFRLSGNPQEIDQPAAFSFELRWYASPAQITATAQ
jgi:Tfp pilus assembly protein PilO